MRGAASGYTKLPFDCGVWAVEACLVRDQWGVHLLTRFDTIPVTPGSELHHCISAVAGTVVFWCGWLLYYWGIPSVQR